VKTRFWAGKTLFLALLSVSISACGSGLPFGRKQADTETLQASVTDPQVRAFYEARQWKSAWDKKAERALLDIVADAPANGLKPDLFLKEPFPRDANAREATLTSAALRYASALARGYSDPRKISAVYTIRRSNPDVAKGLAQALANGDLKDWYASLPPQTDEYRALSKAHLAYLQQAAKGTPRADPRWRPNQSGPPRPARSGDRCRTGRNRISGAADSAAAAL
jgi:murein L,D-transpeptidase YcbB/YkuD